MKVPFHLRPRLEPMAVTALLLPSEKPADLLALVARLGLDPFPSVYAVAGGFLVKLPRPTPDAWPGALRLGGPAANLLLPIDAELVPALRDDEATALVVRRGLIFLPGGRVLEFAPDRPLPPTAFVDAPPPLRRPWQALPEPPPRAERILGIVLDQPMPSLDDLLEGGREEIGTEESRPEDSHPVARSLGRAGLNFGKGLAWLGQALGIPALSRLGARGIAAALELAPRLTEELIGRQEAALRALLGDFRAGNIERALRRALPLGGECGRGSRPAGDARLPWENFLYSLSKLLGSGPGSLWFGSADVYHELAAEYRKQAEQAARAGDYRRAAYIYGKLLADFHAAAEVLAKGGLHHDAALIYLVKLGNRLAAAKEFEAAGQFDRALEIYREQGAHERAGDLLRQLGDMEQAIAEYRRAAAQLVATGYGPYRAGEMLLHRAGLPDIAQEYYAAGWTIRHEYDDAVVCAIRLAQSHAGRGAGDRLLSLIEEADAFLHKPGNASLAAEFYNEVVRLADDEALAPLRADLRDRALMGLAAKMSQQLSVGSRSAEIATAFLGRFPAWPPALVGDARYALRHGQRQTGH